MCTLAQFAAIFLCLRVHRALRLCFMAAASTDRSGHGAESDGERERRNSRDDGGAQSEHPKSRESGNKLNR